MSLTISLAGRTALVTGGGRGIGRAIALTLAQAGANVGLCFNRDEAAAAASVADIEALGRRAHAWHCDVGDHAQCLALVQDCTAYFGALDILVNNSGMASRGQCVADTAPAELERVLRVNALAPFWLTQAALPHLRLRGRADVVMVSSVATRRLSARGAPYAMSKAALEALAATLAKEERAHGVRCHVVSPSLTDTDMGRRLVRERGEDDIRSLDSNSPFGRVSAPQDVANVVAFLVSDANPYASGQNLAIDGGG
jgi:NAD(P)-dependent dehydrogenase (short-subunit alcohol dehydrogenase family)